MSFWPLKVGYQGSPDHEDSFDTLGVQINLSGSSSKPFSYFAWPSKADLGLQAFESGL